jgi:hypothetical protein
MLTITGIVAGATRGTSGAETAKYSFRLAIEQQSSAGAGAPAASCVQQSQSREQHAGTGETSDGAVARSSSRERMRKIIEA